MTDQSSHPIFAPLETLAGVAGNRKNLFKRLLGKQVIDSLLHLPVNVLKYRSINSIEEAETGENVTIEVDILSHESNPYRSRPYKIIATDGKNKLEITYFNANQSYLLKLYPIGTRKIIVGKIDRYLSQITIPHPTAVYDSKNAQHIVTHEVIYPLTNGITNKCVQRVVSQALSRLPDFPDWLDDKVRQQNDWPSWREAILNLHAPKSVIDLSMQSKSRQRLAFDEFLSHQLGLQLARQFNQRLQKGLAQNGDGILVKRLLKSLPFELTEAQNKVIAEIFADMAAPHPMSRLIQGDVGSGKTVVALMAMLKSIESGNQAAILAPTDILARQHGETIIELAATIGIKADLLTGREKGKIKSRLLEQLKEGTIDLIIGTHALIQENVDFKQLGLVVIDEQHRFGVEQRLQLSTKGQNPDVLAMTATPIPRTLQLANYGDMDVSVLDQKPAGRLPIQTTVISQSRMDEIIEGIKRPLAQGAKIFWVCPLVKESESLDLSAAEDRLQHLQLIFGTRVGMVHGQMKPQEKDKVMDDFINRSVDILIATTVIEVGVNVPTANIMIIEHAERFGLAQLHQLRGRIGRGTRQGKCVLLYGKQITQVGKKRLEVMRETSDGFKIAEADLKLRGSGDILGTRQSGIPGFKIADFVEYPEICANLLSLANKEAKQICTKNPLLKGTNGEAIARLLRIFGRDEAMRYTRS